MVRSAHVVLERLALKFGTEDLRIVHPCPIVLILLLQIPPPIEGYRKSIERSTTTAPVLETVEIPNSEGPRGQRLVWVVRLLRPLARLQARFEPLRNEPDVRCIRMVTPRENQNAQQGWMKDCLFGLR